LASNTTSGENTAVGFGALAAQNTGTPNDAFGNQSLCKLTTGTQNTGLGFRAMCDVTTGVRNVSVGNSAGYKTTTGNENVAIGRASNLSNTTGNNNVSVGHCAGYNITTGGQNINIGGFTTVASATASYSLAIGYNIVGKGAGTGYIAPDGTSSGGIYQGNNSSSWSTTSDKRIKKNIVDNTTGLDKINQIQIRNFEYRKKDEITELPKHSAIEKSGIQIGVIAQEIETILPDVVKEESTGVKSVDPSNLTWYLINAIKELKAEIDELKKGA